METWGLVILTNLVIFFLLMESGWESAASLQTIPNPAVSKWLTVSGAFFLCQFCHLSSTQVIY